MVDEKRGGGDPSASTPRAIRRIAAGVSYRGTAYKGWQSQPGGGTVQDLLEQALSRFAARPIKVMCAGRTDAGVHGINQVVHLDTDIHRESFSWVRGPNAFLPPDIAVQWAQEVTSAFHARNSARGRRYAYVLLESPVRPAIESAQAGWVFRPLSLEAMKQAAAHLIGEHDFSSFRSSQCQSITPIKTLRRIDIRQIGPYWRFDFEGNAFLHHMIRNIMGCLIAVGSGTQSPDWMIDVLAARNRDAAAPTFSPDGLYFLGPTYDSEWGLPTEVAGMAWLPGNS